MVLCAPVGFGKTTLLVDWLRSRLWETQPPSAVWLSLDEDDNDPVQFLRLLVAGLRTAIPGIGETTLTMMQGPLGRPLRTSLTPLINELHATAREIILVLDDYHVIRLPFIHELVTFLLEHLPPLVRAVIATREDPPLRLPKLRAHGAVRELRAADLRFTQDEAATFLRGVMELAVSAEEAAALEARTEGWIAGLQLAGLSIPERGVSGFIAGFGGNHRYFLDYLGAEVLARQPRSVQTFLLRTSVLDQLSAPLCEAVLGEERPEGGTQAMLEQIERANLFLLPLDTERRWFRFHQLFAEFLHFHLMQTGPDRVPDLHRRASGWYEEHGLIPEAIRHALAAPEPDRVARLIEQHHMSFLLDGRRQTLLEWCRALPAGIVQGRPRLCVAYAYAQYLTNQGGTAATYLQAGEQHLRRDLPPDEAAFLRGRIAVLRAMMAWNSGDLARAVALAIEALDLLPAADIAGRTWARIIAGRAFRVSGDVTPASERAVASAAEQAKTEGLPLAWALIEIARFHVLQGRLHRAGDSFAEAERVLSQQAASGAPTYCFGLGDLLREWNDLDGAAHLLSQGIESITEGGRIAAYVAEQGYIAMTRIRQARGDNHGAMATLDEFVGLARRREWAAPVLARAAAVRAHLWLMQGNLVAAAHWVDTSGLGPDDPVNFLREPEYLVLARGLIARKNRVVLALLDRRLEEAEAHGRMGSAIEILALRALALQALGQAGGALTVLERALALGEPEGYVRVFVDEGAPMATLLRRARTRGIAPEYAARLLRAFGTGRPDPNQSRPAALDKNGTAESPPEAPSGLMDPLTGREREILRLIVAGASNQEIARTLVVTPGTVKTHVYHIFGKLGVRSRAQAIAQAKALRLD